MATRLYPSTSNVSLLEQIANVPLGTSERLAALESHFPNLHSYKPEHMGEHEAYFNAKSEDPALDTYDSFLLYGWGGLSPEAYDLVCSWGMEGCGSTSDRNRMYQLLRAQGIAKACTLAARLDSLSWG